MYRYLNNYFSLENVYNSPSTFCTSLLSNLYAFSALGKVPVDLPYGSFCLYSPHTQYAFSKNYPMLARFGGENGSDSKVGNSVLKLSSLLCEILCSFCNVSQNLTTSAFASVVYRPLVLV